MTSGHRDPFGARAEFDTGSGRAAIYRLDRLEKSGVAAVSRLPFSIRVLLENLLRGCDGDLVTEEDVRALAAWQPGPLPAREIPFMPSRVVLQDFTGVPCVADLAAMRNAVARMGGDPDKINPLVPVDLVIDHSVQVDVFGSSAAFLLNVEREYERNQERYAFLKWAQKSFKNFRVVPPGTGIVHQVNLEFLGQVIDLRDGVAFFDTLVGTDSHTTMINGLGVLGWGVGGIEAEAVMLGQPYYLLMPQVVGFKLTGRLPEGATATDLVLTVTQMLRKKGVVDKFVEFYGAGLSQLGVADRATIANMAPEYGATMGFFPVDDLTLSYLRLTGRSDELVARVERYCKEQGLFRTDATPDPLYTDTLELDMSTVEPSLAGPRRPQDRIPLTQVSADFKKQLSDTFGKQPAGGVAVAEKVAVEHGAVAIAAITSCTNTSNPSVMVGAGLVAKKAVEKGLKVPPWVKTSLAPGSRVVTEYLDKAGLTPYLDALGFNLVGYGCTTCIGNSGNLVPEVEQQVREKDLVVAAVLSGNRNFEGRVQPLIKANYLASPMLVVAYAIAGNMHKDIVAEPLGEDADGNPVYLRDIWPSMDEVRRTMEACIDPAMFRRTYGTVFAGDEQWRQLPVPEGALYDWDARSTYIKEPPYFMGMPPEPPPLTDVHGARVLVAVGDSVTTDHISPAGDIALAGPAGQYLVDKGVPKVDFNTYGARRGNHEVMMRGTFANVRLRNALAGGKEGWWTAHQPDGEEMTIFDAAMRYQAEGIPLIVLAGKDYGMGSSRDWAAKGPMLLGVRAAIAESYERIHRTNLIGMGVLPLQFKEGQSWKSLGLTGREEFDITGISGDLRPRMEATVTARREDAGTVTFPVIVRLDSRIEIGYYRNGGILQTVLRKMMRGS